MKQLDELYAAAKDAVYIDELLPRIFARSPNSKSKEHCVREPGTLLNTETADKPATAQRGAGSGYSLALFVGCRYSFGMLRTRSGRKGDGGLCAAGPWHD